MPGLAQMAHARTFRRSVRPAGAARAAALPWTWTPGVRLAVPGAETRRPHGPGTGRSHRPTQTLTVATFISACLSCSYLTVIH